MNCPSTIEANESSVKSDTCATVLVVDDEPAICWAFQRLLRDEGHRVLKASSAEEGLQIAANNALALVLLDVRLPKEDGISALPKFLAVTGNTPVVVMTAFGDLETAVAAISNGAIDYLTKPFRLEDALRTCRSALRRPGARSSPYASASRSVSDNKIVGRSSAIQHAFRQIALVADSDLSVLITGETGTGKELVAEAIHRHSRRSKSPYLPIAPVSLNPELIESELFGHAHGAFTGAITDRAGVFEQAEGGTILLDEIGDLPLNIQVKLLRVLEQGDYCRVGDAKPRKCNVRILAATNCDLNRAVSDGSFRQDLFYRLNGLHIRLPALRERPEDLEPLCMYFLRRIAYPESAATLDDELLSALAARPWSGNVRELKNAVEHAAIIARGRPLAIEDFPSVQAPPASNFSSARAELDRALAVFLQEQIEQPSGESCGLHQRLLAATEPAMLEVALRYTGGNRLKAAEVLGMHRGTLRERLRHYKLDE